MAEALAKRFLNAEICVKSAGLSPQPEYDSKSAKQTLLSEFGIDASDHRPTDVLDVKLDDFTYVVAMDARIAKRLARITDHEIITWQIDDPWGGDDAEYRDCALLILRALRT